MATNLNEKKNAAYEALFGELLDRTLDRRYPTAITKIMEELEKPARLQNATVAELTVLLRLFVELDQSIADRVLKMTAI